MWIWEAVRAGQLTLAEKPDSPFFEASEADPCRINPNLRFAEIFAPLFAAIKDEESSTLKKAMHEISCIILHILAWQDIASGLDRRELSLRRLDEELSNGVWGQIERQAYAVLDKLEQRQILNLLHERLASGHLPLLRALKQFFPATRIWHMEKTAEMVIAVPYPDDSLNRAKMNLLIDLFLPLDQPFMLLWSQTPCILDSSDDAALGTCVLSQ